MNALLVALFQSFPFVVVIAAAALFVVYAGVTLGKPRFLVYPYLALLFTITGSTFGLLEATSPSIWGRGSGVLYFSFILWLLLAASVWARLSMALAKLEPPPCSLYGWIIAWLTLLVAHTLVAAFLGVPIKDALSPMGFSNFIWMGCLIVLLLAAFRSQEELTELSNFIVLVALGRAIFGLIRWAAFGGDPANAYANRTGVLIKLTFFDINESLLFMIALTICVIRLFKDDSSTRSRIWTVIFWLTAIAAIACIVLSFRRTAWVGLLLGGLVVLTQLPARRRAALFLVVAPGVLAAMAYGAWKRLSQTKGAGGLEAFFFDIQTNTMGADSQRTLELKFAFGDFLSSPIWGIGSWGRYTGHQMISWQNGDFPGGFVHSGLVHTAFKSGLIGLILLAGMYISYIRFVRRSLPSVAQPTLPLFVAGVAGIAFMLPDMMIGTPIPQVRTMQMLAFCFALPYLAHGVPSNHRITKQARSAFPMARRTRPWTAAPLPLSPSEAST